MRKIFIPSVLCLLLSLTIISTPQAQSNLTPEPSQAPAQTGISVTATQPALSAEELLDWMVFKYENVPFEFASSRLTSAARKILKRKADWIKDQNLDTKLVLIGHCDQRGPKDYNKRLGIKRANAAKQYLIIQGIPKDRVQIISAGDEQPLQHGKGEHVWEKNRRVEVLEN